MRLGSVVLFSSRWAAVAAAAAAEAAEAGLDGLLDDDLFDYLLRLEGNSSRHK